MIFQAYKGQRIFYLLPNYAAWQDRVEINEYGTVKRTFYIYYYFNYSVDVKENIEEKFCFYILVNKSFFLVIKIDKYKVLIDILSCEEIQHPAFYIYLFVQNCVSNCLAKGWKLKAEANRIELMAITPVNLTYSYLKYDI